MRTPSVIFMGSKPGAVAALDVLMRRGWDVRAVVVTKETYQPWVAGPTLAEAAHANGLTVHLQKDLPRRPADYVISYMYRNLVKPDVLALARHGAVNFHAAPLPMFGGFGCYNRAVLQDEARFGVTCHHMDGDFDTGDIVRIGWFPLEPARETAYSVERKAQDRMVRLFDEICALAESNRTLPRAPQDLNLRHYLTEAALDALKDIPAGADAATIDRYARAFWYPPYGGARLDTGAGTIEPMPEIAKQEIAALLHDGDTRRLLHIAANGGGARAAE